MIRTLVKLSETKILLKNQSFLNDLLTKVTSTTTTNTENDINKVIEKNNTNNKINDNGIDLLNILAPTDTSNIKQIPLQSLNNDNNNNDKQLMANFPFNKEEKISSYLTDKEYDNKSLTMKEVEKNHFDSISMQLKYILNNFSNNNKYNSNLNDFSNLKLINDLLYMKNSKIYSLILKLKDENKLMIIFSHLLFINNEIKIDYLIRILMKVNLDKILFIDQKIQSNLNNIFNLKIEKNYNNLMKFQIALASRYMILNSKLMSITIINKFLDKFWLNLIKNGKFTSINYIRNLIRLIQNINKENDYELNLINEKFLNLIKDTKNFKIGLIFWEENFKNYEIIEIFENLINNNNNKNNNENNKEFIINSNENLIISFITNPLISTKKLNLSKLRTISINSHTPSPSESSSLESSSSSSSSTNTGSFNKRLVASLEVLINELEDNYTISYSNQFDQIIFENYLNNLKNSLNEYKLNHNHVKNNNHNHNQNHNHELSFIKS